MKTFLFSSILLSITALVDSLQQVILTHQENQDIAAECEALFELAEVYQSNKMFVQNDSILEIINIRSINEKYINGQADYLIHKATNERKKGNLKEAEKHLLELLDKFESVIDPDRLTKAYSMIGFISYKRGDKEGLKKYIDKQELIFDKIETKNKIFMYQDLARYENSFGSMVKAIDYRKKSLEINLKEANTNEIGHDYTNLGIYFSGNNQRDSAVYYYNKSLELSRSHLDTLRTLENLSFLIDENILAGNLTDAIRNIEEGKKLAEIIDNKNSLGGFNMHLGRIYQMQGNNDDAMLALNKSLKIGEEIESLYLTIVSRRHMIQIYQAKEEYDKALELINLDYDVFTKRGDKGGQAARLGAMADIFSKQGKYEMAVDKLKQALHITKSTGRSQYYSQFYFGISRVFENMESADSILFYVSKAKEFLPENYTLHEEQQIQRLSYVAYEIKGDHENAMKHHKQYHDTSMEIINTEKQEYVAEQQVKQNVEMIEKDKAMAEQEAAVLNTRNKLYLWIALGLFGFLMLGAYLFNQLRKTKRKLDSQNEELQQLNTTKDKFFGIIAHDIRSPLIALEGVGDLMKHYLKTNNKEKLERLSLSVEATSKKLSGLLDNLLKWALLQQGVLPYNPKSISVKETAEEVVALFKETAQNKNINIDINTNESDHVYADEAALNTILRNLISNAIKFTQNGGNVSLSTELKNNKIYININDTGTGISAERLHKIFHSQKESQIGTSGEKGTGLGLTLVKELTNLNKGEIEVKSEIDKGTQFSVSLPMAA